MRMPVPAPTVVPLGLPTVRPPLPVIGLLIVVVAPLLVRMMRLGGAEGQGAADDRCWCRSRRDQAAAAQRQGEAAWPTVAPPASSRAVMVLLPARTSLPVSLTMSPGPAAAIEPRSR